VAVWKGTPAAVHGPDGDQDLVRLRSVALRGPARRGRQVRSVEPLVPSLAMSTT